MLSKAIKATNKVKATAANEAAANEPIPRTLTDPSRGSYRANVGTIVI